MHRLSSDHYEVIIKTLPKCHHRLLFVKKENRRYIELLWISRSVESCPSPRYRESIAYYECIFFSAQFNIQSSNNKRWTRMINRRGGGGGGALPFRTFCVPLMDSLSTLIITCSIYMDEQSIGTCSFQWPMFRPLC